ncbi:nicotinate-nucleotide--dimethylbenzimidazole phosphoribosyltransferase, partial [Saccharomonospora iraqiensis]|uniref:nicotinate-nucleotide--dimethylbenzimidazole phosphoribosyltransferase n=1 Tax=Saccharomonospora iraqiensis TaxID=52698 RepID=UPI00022E1C66
MSDNSAAERDGATPGGNGIDGDRVDWDGATEGGATESGATEDGAAANRLTEDGTADESVRFADVPARFALTDPRPSRTRPRFGRLEELGFLLATCRGQLPPRPPRHVRVVVLAADHGIAARGVSARGPGDTARRFDALLAGGTPLGVLVDEAGAGLRAVDLAIEHGSGPYHVRDGSGAIDVEDALTAAETTAALRGGAELADAEVDAGADLLIPADLAVGG